MIRTRLPFQYTLFLDAYNQHLKDSWPMMGLEVVVGVIIYGVMVILLKASIVDQTKELITNRFKK